MFKNIGLVIKGNLSSKNNRVIEELVGLIKTKSRNVYLENSSTSSPIKGGELISQELFGKKSDLINQIPQILILWKVDWKRWGSQKPRHYTLPSPCFMTIKRRPDKVTQLVGLTDDKVLVGGPLKKLTICLKLRLRSNLVKIDL